MHVLAKRADDEVPVVADSGLITRVVRELDDAGVQLNDVGLRRPTLDDVFLALTGHAVDDVSNARPLTSSDKNQIGEEAA